MYITVSHINANKSQVMTCTGQGFFDSMHAAFFSKHFFPQNQSIPPDTENRPQVCYNLGKSYSTYESHPSKVVAARPKFSGSWEQAK